jgi:hypothetical protein
MRTIGAIGSNDLPNSVAQVRARGCFHRPDALSKAERYRRAANRYGEMAKQAEPGYLADVFRKIAMRYVLMAEDVLREAERRALRTQ